MAKIKEMREKLDSELAYETKELQKELFELRFKSSSEGLANPHRIQTLRRDIARMKTLLAERQQGIRGAAPRT